MKRILLLALVVLNSCATITYSSRSKEKCREHTYVALIPIYYVRNFPESNQLTKAQKDKIIVFESAKDRSLLHTEFRNRVRHTNTKVISIEETDTLYNSIDSAIYKTASELCKELEVDAILKVWITKDDGWKADLDLSDPKIRYNRHSGMVTAGTFKASKYNVLTRVELYDSLSPAPLYSYFTELNGGLFTNMERQNKRHLVRSIEKLPYPENE